jgi:dihydrolipoamide dehydrogenase
VLTGTKIVGYEASNGADGIAVNLETPSGNESLTAAAALEAVGIQGNTEDIGLEAAGVATERGFIVIDEGMRTNVPSIFAIGDVTGKLPLAHVASAQGVAVVEALAGLDTAPLDYGIVPRAVYCQPQVASWGLSEEAAREAGHEIQVGKFPFTANGKALGLGEPQGSVKLVVDARYGAILGAHLIGPDVTELLAELSMTRALEGTADELGAMVHAHPSLSEALKEAALAARGQPIHL